MERIFVPGILPGSPSWRMGKETFAPSARAARLFRIFSVCKRLINAETGKLVSPGAASFRLSDYTSNWCCVDRLSRHDLSGLSLAVGVSVSHRSVDSSGAGLAWRHNYARQWPVASVCN